MMDTFSLEYRIISSRPAYAMERKLVEKERGSGVGRGKEGERGNFYLLLLTRKVSKPAIF